MTVVQRQPQIWELFSKQLIQDKVSHAYLLVGENDTLPFSIYMAQSLFCSVSTDGACGQCEQCRKIAENNHADFIHISGKEKSIKKEDILKIQERFIQTSLEQSKYKVYIIEDVDNSSISAMNSFLKFLEDPTSNIVAILTTSKASKVLDTIKSRCLLLHLKNEQNTKLIETLIKKNINKDIAFLLARIAQDEVEAEEIYDSEKFKAVLNTFQTLEKYYREKRYKEAGIFLQVSGNKSYKFDLQAIEWLCIIHELNYSVLYKEHPGQLDIDDLRLLKIATDIKDRIRPGVVASMLLDQFAYELALEV